MSGIAGILDLDGSPVAPALLQSMVSAMQYRGRDGSRIWADGPAGLAHCHFWTTPEDVGEAQPISAAGGRYWLTADARIDNRDDLIPLLAGKGLLNKTIPTDAEIILAAYECWGEQCPIHLLGDFAFALWDAAERRLFLARDVIGLRQVHYALVDGVFYFATNISVILAVLPRQPALNRQLIADYLAGSYQSWIYETMYEGVMSVPPSYSMTVTGNGLAKRLYYVPDGKAYHFASDGEWIEAFRDLLYTVVRCHLRSTSPIGMLVSGGLDSSSLACVAHDLAEREPGLPPVHMYSWVYPETPSSDQSEYLDAVVARCPRFPITRVVSDEWWALRDYETADSPPLEEPDANMFRGQSFAMLRQCAADGCGVVLSGSGGDATLCQGLYYEPAVLRGLTWRSQASEARYFYALSRQSWPSFLFRVYAKPLVDAYIRPIVPDQARTWRRNRRSLSHNMPWLLVEQRPSESELDRAFFTPPGLTPAGQFTFRSCRLLHDIVASGAVDDAGAVAGVETRAPLWDRRILEFALAAPQRLQAFGGANRVILRQALRETLPGVVRQRMTKSGITGPTNEGFRSRERPRIEAIFGEMRLEGLGIVDGLPLREAYSIYVQDETKDYKYLMRVLSVEMWLRSTAATCSVTRSKVSDQIACRRL